MARAVNKFLLMNTSPFPQSTKSQTWDEKENEKHIP
jgi:hypothetical protein